MAARPAVALLLTALLLAGTATGTAPEHADKGAETLYLYDYRMEPVPNNATLDGNGLHSGGCEGGLLLPGVDSCWWATFYGPARSSHRAGDPVRVFLWMQGLGVVGQETVIEAVLSDEVTGSVLAQGESAPIATAPGTPVEGPDGCDLAVIEAALSEDVAAGAPLVLALTGRNITGMPCRGGGADGNRLELGEVGGRPHPGGGGGGDGGGSGGSEPTAPEVLYAHAHLFRIQPEPDARPLEGYGFRYGGDVCHVEVLPPDVGSMLPCWGTAYTGQANAAHAAGDRVRLVFWVEGAATEPVTLAAWLDADGVRVAEGRSEPFVAQAGTPLAGPDGCLRVEAEMALAADVPQGTPLVLSVKVPGLLGGECWGGGLDGNRVEIGLP